MKTGLVFLRTVDRDVDDKGCEFVRTLRTNKWVDARHIRAPEAMPIIIDMERD